MPIPWNIFRPAIQTLVAIGLFGVLLSSPARAQPGETESFSESIEVRVINLDVVVTDRQGKRVPNLGPDDFRLKVDGEDVPIDFFTEIREGRAITSEGARSAPSVNDGETVPVNYLVFIDAMWGFKGNVAKILEGLRADLESLQPGDKMAVTLYDGERLHQIQGWTPLRSQLVQAFERVQAGEFGGIDRADEENDFNSNARTRRAFLDEGDDPLMEAKIVEAEDMELHVRTEELYAQLDRVTRAAAAAMQTAAPPPGRKVMLLLVGGWRSEFDTNMTNGRPQEHLFRLTETANLLGYTLYAADTPIQRIGSEVSHHESLDFLAEKTGGRSYKQAAGIEVLSRATEDVRTYYWMGFTAPSKGDGGIRAIDLDVLKPGLTVRSRTGFVDRSRQAEVDEIVRSASLLGRLPTALPLEVQLGVPQRKGRRMEVPLRLRIPLDAITMLPGAEGHTARLELRVSGIDDEGSLNDLPVIPVTFSGPEPGPGQMVTYETTIRLRARKHDLMVALYDLVSGTILLGSEELDL